MAGNVKADLAEFPKLPLTEAKVIARRAAMELKAGTSINLGIGIPQNIASVVNEEKCGKYVTLTSESGTVGGVAITGKAFGNCWNPECFLDEDVQFTWYCGGGLGAAFLGLAETDECGNVNVSKFGPRFNGPGGFIDITQPTKKVIFCGAFMAGKLQTEVKDGKIHIVNEGKFRKFVSKVGQVTFSGDYAVESGQEVMYITERGVFELTKDGLMLTEIAPGIDLEKDILANMDFKPIISPNLKEMDAALFQEDWGGLKAILIGHTVFCVPYILMEVKDKIAYVTLNRGPANAFVNEMYVEFANTLLELGERDDVAVVVVRANGKIFCGGNDISAFDSFDSRTKANYSAECCGKAAGAVWDCKKPVICAVQGAAMGAGMCIAAASDFIIAGEGVKFGIPEVKLGIPAAGVFARMIVPLHKAKWMAFTGNPVTAEELYQYGTVMKVVPKAEVWDEADKFAHEMAASCYRAVSIFKQNFCRNLDARLYDQFMVEQNSFMDNMMYSHDFKEAIAAFTEKRAPEFNGK